MRFVEADVFSRCQVSSIHDHRGFADTVHGILTFDAVGLFNSSSATGVYVLDMSFKIIG